MQPPEVPSGGYFQDPEGQQNPQRLKPPTLGPSHPQVWRADSTYFHSSLWGFIPIPINIQDLNDRQNKTKQIPTSGAPTAAQWVKDLLLSLRRQWVKDLALPRLRLGCDPWPGEFSYTMSAAIKKKKKKKKIPVLQIFNLYSVGHRPREENHCYMRFLPLP